MNPAAAPRGSALPPLSLKGRALRLLAAREYSRAELEHKLARHESEPGQLQAVLDELTHKGFINEQRVAESVLHQLSKRHGGARIAQTLRAKGLDSELVKQTLQQAAASEGERARMVWAKKFGIRPQTPTEHARQMRFLAARGFSAEVCYQILREQD